MRGGGEFEELKELMDACVWLAAVETSIVKHAEPAAGKLYHVEERNLLLFLLMQIYRYSCRYRHRYSTPVT